LKLRHALVGAFLFVVPLATVAGVAGWGWRTLHQPFHGWSGDELRLSIETGWDAGRILDELEQKGAVVHAGLARLYLLYVLEDPRLQAGEYLFEEPLATPAALDRIVRGDVATYPVTLVEGQTLEETAATLAAAGFGAEARLLEVMGDPAPILDLDPAAADLEGYLFPDTYRFARGATEEVIVAALVSNFRQQLATALAGKEPESVRELLTLASIVEKEAQLASERPLIAGVFAHRLRRGIPLQADPTVIYALKEAGRWDGNIRRPDLKLDSPYNTYVQRGLPPGPICSPGLGSLAAAASPSETEHLYFVSRNDGSHVFAETLAQHNRNVNEWQKRYWQRKWARAAETARSQKSP
jgi:UPF0755 protein